MSGEFRFTSDILLKLKLSDQLTGGHDYMDFTLNVNGVVIYYLVPKPGGRDPFQVRRSVKGTVISIPATYPQRYVYEHDHYLEGGW